MEARVSITELPPAVLGTILAHLPTKERARTLVCCRAWNAAASHNPEVWADVRASLSNEARVRSFVAWLAPRRHLVRSILVQQAVQLPADLKGAGSSWHPADEAICAEQWPLVPRALAGGRCERLQLCLTLDNHLMSGPLRLSTQDLLALPHLRHWELRANKLAVAVDLDPTQLAQLDALTALIINAPAPIPVRGRGRDHLAAATTPALAPGIFPPALVQLGLPIYPSGLPLALPAAAPHIRSLLCSGPGHRGGSGMLRWIPRPIDMIYSEGTSWEGLAELRSLTSLSLLGCDLDRLPQSLTALSALQALDLQYNFESSQASQDSWQPLAALTALTSLSVGACSLEELPMVGPLLEAAAAAGSGGGLRRLDLHSNKALTPWDLDALKELTSLRELSVYHCDLGELPEWLWTSLEALQLNCAGSMPLPADGEPTVTRLEASLKDLVVMEAEFEGSLERLASLRELYVSAPEPPRGQGRALLRAVRCALPALRVLGILNGLEHDMALPHLLRLRAERPKLAIRVDEDDFGGSREEGAWVEWEPPQQQQQEAAEGGGDAREGGSEEGGSISGDSDSMVAQYMYAPEGAFLSGGDESSAWGGESEEEDSEGSSSSGEGGSEEEWESDASAGGSRYMRGLEGRRRRRRARRRSRGSSSSSAGSEPGGQQGSGARRAAAAVASAARQLLTLPVLLLRVLLAWVVGLLLVRWGSLRWQRAMLSWLARKLRQVWGRGGRPHDQ